MNRREFLHAALGCGAGAMLPAVAAARAAEAPSSRYRSLDPFEAAFVENMVNVLCPADSLTLNGADSGLAAFIDRQLAGAYGKGERVYRMGPWRQGKAEFGYQLPLTPEEFFKAGLKAADELCRDRHGRGFAELPAALADRFLEDMAGGSVSHSQVSLTLWFNEVVYPLFVEGCFSDPIYGGNRGKVFWKLIGYPGLPASYASDMAAFRGKPHPGARTPKSIADY